MQNLLVELADARFSQTAVHHALEALDRHGIQPLREHHTPERVLAWIDAECAGTYSSEAAAGGIWVAQSERGPLGFAAYDLRGLRYHWLRYWLTKSSVGILGPLAVIETARNAGLGTTLLHAALFSLRERGYRRALIPAVPSAAIPFYERAAGAWGVENVDLARGGRRWRATVLASGNGSNFAAVAEGAAAGTLPLEIVALVCDRPRAFALARAAALNVPAHLVAWERDAETREAYDGRVLAAVAQTQPELVLLLGWMHVLPPTFIARFPEILNVHPAFLPLDPEADFVTMPDGSTLPAFRGPRAFDDALRANAGWSGASVHRVGVAVDRGIVIARGPLELEAGAERAILETKLHALERRVVATAIRSWSFEQP